MRVSSWPALTFSCLGHFYIHMLASVYFVIVLTLEIDWQESYDELIKLWTVGSVLLGLMAIPAGRFADAWSVRGTIILFFLGMGGASIACGLVSTPTFLMLGLAGVGFFGAIYHPVGIPWLMRNAGHHTGKILAVNGIFGSIGNACASLVAGILIDLAGWQAAFIVPGAVCVMTGLAMLWFVVRGTIVDGGRDETVAKPVSRGDMMRVVPLLLLALAVEGIIYQSTQGAMPKLFSVRLGDYVGGGATGIGVLVSSVYLAGAVMQIVGGFLADRYALKTIFITCWIVQVPLLMGLAMISGVGLVGAAALAVMANLAMLPAENMLLYRYAPERHRGLVFGVSYFIAFTAGPVSIFLISWVWGATGGFGLLFGGIAATALMVALLLLYLPNDEARATAPAAAE